MAEFCAVFPAAMAAYSAVCEGGSADDWSQALPDCGAAVRSEALGRLTLDVEQADACLHNLSSGHQCQSFSCSEVLAGTIPEGGVCNNIVTPLGGECEPGLECPAARSSACTSVCRPPSLLAEGENCGGMFNNSTCPPPLQCDADIICSVPLGEGESCRATSDCRPELYCVFTGESEALGSCQPRVGRDGAPCESFEECVLGHRCVGPDGAKACRLPKRIGDSCTFGLRECSRQCSPEGVCAVVAREGDLCGQVEDPTTGGSESLLCANDLYCETESSTCQKRIEVGASCLGVLSQGDPCARSAEGFVECGTGPCQLCELVKE